MYKSNSIWQVFRDKTSSDEFAGRLLVIKALKQFERGFLMISPITKITQLEYQDQFEIREPFSTHNCKKY